MTTLTTDQLRAELDSLMGPCTNCDGKWVHHYDGSKVICSHVEMLDKIVDLFATQLQSVREAQNTVQERALRWLLGEHTGVSSKTLCGHMLGIDVGWQSPPSDKDDRSRCIRLLQLIPEWESRLDEVIKLESKRSIVIDSQGMREGHNGWDKQVPLIRAELKVALDKGFGKLTKE